MPINSYDATGPPVPRAGDTNCSLRFDETPLASQIFKYRVEVIRVEPVLLFNPYPEFLVGLKLG